MAVVASGAGGAFAADLDAADSLIAAREADAAVGVRSTRAAAPAVAAADGVDAEAKVAAEGEESDYDHLSWIQALTVRTRWRIQGRTVLRRRLATRSWRRTATATAGCAAATLLP